MMVSPADSEATTDAERSVVAHVKTCREKLGYPFELLGRYGASGCCFGEFGFKVGVCRGSSL